MAAALCDCTYDVQGHEIGLICRQQKTVNTGGSVDGMRERDSPAVSLVCRKCTALTEHTGACSLTAAGRLTTNRSKAAGSASIAKPCMNSAHCHKFISGVMLSNTQGKTPCEQSSAPEPVQPEQTCTRALSKYA